MDNFPIEMQLNRTIAAIRQMAEGSIITLPSGHKIGMGEDLSIGFVMQNNNGETTIGGLSTIDFKQLNGLLNEAEMFAFHVPDMKRAR